MANFDEDIKRITNEVLQDGTDGSGTDVNIIGIIKEQECGHCGVDDVTAQISAAIGKTFPKADFCF